MWIRASSLQSYLRKIASRIRHREWTCQNSVGTFYDGIIRDLSRGMRRYPSHTSCSSSSKRYVCRILGWWRYPIRHLRCFYLHPCINPAELSTKTCVTSRLIPSRIALSKHSHNQCVRLLLKWSSPSDCVLHVNTGLDPVVWQSICPSRTYT